MKNNKSRFYLKVERYVEVEAESYDEALRLYLSRKAQIDQLSNIQLDQVVPVDLEC
jgi:hypothetical protein